MEHYNSQLLATKVLGFHTVLIMKELILLTIAAILFCLFIYVVVSEIDRRNNKKANDKEMFELLEQWPEIKSMKYLNITEFSKNVLLLKEKFLPNTGGIIWKENHLKGKYFEMEFWGETRFYPSTNTFGKYYIPSYYIQDDKQMQIYYIDILTRLGDYMYAVFVTNKN